MKKIAVVFQSNYGATRQYAAWIAKELHGELLERKKVSPEQLKKYDCVVYGGGLYAGRINGANPVIKAAPQNLVLFTVGLYPPETTDYTEILSKILPPEQAEHTKVFHFRGAMDYEKLKPVHRALVNMMKKMVIGKKPYEDCSPEEKAFLDSYSGKADYISHEAIGPLVAYVQNEL